MMKPRTEADLHKAIVTLAKLMAIDRSLPERRTKLLLLYHIPNGVKPQGRGHSKYVTMAARLGRDEKEMGVRAGMPDLHLPVHAVRPGRMEFSLVEMLVDISLYIEVKLPGVKVPEYQRLIHEELRAEGNRVEVVRDTIEAERIFKEHLAL